MIHFKYLEQQILFVPAPFVYTLTLFLPATFNFIKNNFSFLFFFLLNLINPTFHSWTILILKSRGP